MCDASSRSTITDRNGKKKKKKSVPRQHVRQGSSLCFNYVQISSVALQMISVENPTNRPNGVSFYRQLTALNLSDLYQADARGSDGFRHYSNAGLCKLEKSLKFQCIQTFLCLIPLRGSSSSPHGLSLLRRRHSKSPFSISTYSLYLPL